VFHLGFAIQLWIAIVAQRLQRRGRAGPSLVGRWDHRVDDREKSRSAIDDSRTESDAAIDIAPNRRFGVR